MRTEGTSCCVLGLFFYLSESNRLTHTAYTMTVYFNNKQTLSVRQVVSPATIPHLIHVMNTVTSVTLIQDTILKMDV